MESGYILVNGKSLDLAETADTQTIAGLYNDIAAALDTGKPIIYYGCTYDGDDASPFQAVTVDEGANGIVFYVSTLSVTITSANVVTVADLIPAPEG